MALDNLMCGNHCKCFQWRIGVCSTTDRCAQGPGKFADELDRSAIPIIPLVPGTLTSSLDF